MSASLNYQLAVLAVLAAFCIAQGQATTCHSCSGQACLRTSQVNVTKTCSMTTEQCVSIFTGFVPEKKGCYSDLTANEKTICDAVGNPACYKCTGNNCNHLGRVDHKCKSCIGTSSNSSCLTTPEMVPDTRCTAPRTQDVYCSVNIVGNATHRACVTSNRDIVDCLNKPTMCTLCNVDSMGGCNTNQVPTDRRQCHYCSGDNCEMVNATTTAAHLRYCPASDDRCVSVNFHGVFKRSCAMELAVDVQDYCGKFNASCVYCMASGCNIAVPPNGADKLTLSVSVLAALVVAVFFTTATSGV